jgi:hypothetical protein
MCINQNGQRYLGKLKAQFSDTLEFWISNILVGHD